MKGQEFQNRINYGCLSRDLGNIRVLGKSLSNEILLITCITITQNSAPGSGARFEIHVPGGAYRLNSDG